MLKRKSYNGGKRGSGVRQHLASLVPHGVDTLVELFAGAAALACFIKPVKRTVLVEINRDVLNDIQCQHVPNVERIHGDAFDVIKSHRDIFMRPETIVYIDPPYPRDVRTDQRNAIYQHELWENDSEEEGIHTHLELLQAIKTFACKVMISCYESPLYVTELAAWNVFSYYTTDRAGKRRKEFVWYNFPTPSRLHDSAWIGKNDRDRWRISKRRRRLLAKFKRLPLVEQWAYFDVLTEYMENGENANHSAESEFKKIQLAT